MINHYVLREFLLQRAKKYVKADTKDRLITKHGKQLCRDLEVLHKLGKLPNHDECVYYDTECILFRSNSRDKGE